MTAGKNKPVYISAALHTALKELAPAGDNLMVELVAQKLGELRDAATMQRLLGDLPAKARRCSAIATAQIYLTPPVHKWLKSVAATHGRPLYVLVEAKLSELVNPAGK